MKVLIIENDRSNQTALKKVFSNLGTCNFAVDSKEAVDLYEDSWNDCRPYDIICADIKMSGDERQNMLDRIREIEGLLGIKEQDGAIVITTAAVDKQKTEFDKDKGGLVIAYPSEQASEYVQPDKAHILCLLG